MPIAAVAATVGAAAIGASAQSKAAKKSANAVTQASDQATALQRDIYMDQRGLMAPSITMGASARARQMLMMGYKPDEVRRFLQSTASALAQPAPGTERNPTNAMGVPRGQLNRPGEPGDALGGLGVNGSGSSDQLTGSAGGDNFDWVDGGNWETNSPSYERRVNEGTRAINSNLAARGLFSSGAAAKALTRFGQEEGSKEWEADFRRLGVLAGDGADSTGTVVNVAGNFGQQAGQNIRAAGDARASAYGAQGEAWGDFWGNVVPGGIGAVYGYGQKKWGWG